MRPTALFILAALLCTPAESAFGQYEADCDFFPNIAINVTPVFEQPVVDTSRSLAEINHIARTSSQVIPHYDSVTLGVTHYKPVIEFRAPMMQMALNDGTFCARVEHVDASFGYRDVVIYIANELTSDPCAAQHVLEHEQKHVAVNRRILDEYTPIIQERLYSYFKLYGRIIGPNEDFAGQLVREKASAILTEMSQKVLEENQRRQRLVDTPEEYRRNNVVCNGRINNLVRQFTEGQR